MPDAPRCDHMLYRPPAHVLGRTGAPDDTTKRIALTFDDGPAGSQSTENVLGVLDKYGITATFFVVGQMIAANPDKVGAEAERGHLIANHSRSHPEFSMLTEDQMAEQIDSVNAQIEALGLPTPQFFRPPYGDQDGATLAALLEERGMTSVLWTIDSRDWEISDVDRIYNNVLADLRSAWGRGQLTNIVLFHDIQPHTPAVIDLVIPDLIDEGCEFVTVDVTSGG